MQKHIFRFVITLLFIIFLLPTQVFAANYTTSQNIIYKDNTPITIKGVNWFGAETSEALVPGGLHTRDYKDMIAQMKQAGVNAVRVPFCPNTLKDQPVGYISFENNQNADLRGSNSLGVLDKVLNEMNRQQIYILLDHHRPDCQSISTLWYTSSYSEAQWIQDLNFIANRYRSLDYFLGIDLKNEPHGEATWGTGNNGTDWNTAAERAGESVNRTNANLLIFVEGVEANPTCSATTGHWWGGNFEPLNCTPISTAKIPANKLVLSPHVYGPDVYAQPYFSDGNFPNNLPTIWDRDFGFLAKKGLTVVPGEFGGKYGNGGVGHDVAFQDKLTSYLAENKICNSFYWDWNPDSGDTGGILQNDWRTLWNNKLQMLQKYWQNCGSTTPTSQTIGAPTSAPTTNTGSKIEVYAAGTPTLGTYPELALVINNNKVATFSDVRGNPTNGTFVPFTYTHTNKIQPSDSIQLQFTNDASNGNEDRNVRVDKIIIDGTTYQSEDSSVYSVGSWNSNGCTGGNKQTEWLHCPNGSFTYKLNNNTATTVPPIATPVVTSAPASATDYAISYFNNIQLNGNPVTQTTAPTINFNWGAAAPVANVSADSFSLRAVKTITTNNATYQFKVVADDGVRVYIDNQILIDQWKDQPPTVFTIAKNLTSGTHEIKIEYYEKAGAAQLSFDYTANNTSSIPTPAPTSLSPTATQSSLIKIYAAGIPAGGVYPTLDLLIKNQKVATFSNIQGNPSARQFIEFSFTSNSSVAASDVRLNYINDAVVGSEDRNVMIDRISINGIDYQTESTSTYTEGTWSPSNACGGGNKASEWLHCPGYAQY